MKTLMIVSHPYPEQSRVVHALQRAAEEGADVSVRNLESLYGSDLAGFDLAAEQRAYEGVGRVAFLFPIHWFNLTPMLKAYLNQVWRYGWAFGPNGTALQGKEMQVVVSAGASEHSYSAAGVVRSSIDEVLTPMKASAHYVGMKYLPPLAFYDAMEINEQALESAGSRLVERLNAPLGAPLGTLADTRQRAPAAPRRRRWGAALQMA